MNILLPNNGRLLFLLLISVLIFDPDPGFSIQTDYKSTNIGVIIDGASRVGKEQKTAINIAVQNFNSNSKNQKLFIHFKNITTHPIQAVSAAEGLIKEKHADVIIGMKSWEQAALVADVGKRSQVPVLSFSAAPITPPLVESRWPFLIQMATNSSEEISCIASIVQSYGWRKIIAIYEDKTISGDSGLVTLLSDALHRVGADVEYYLPLPPFSSLNNPEGVIQQEVSKWSSKRSRVFIVLGSSLPLASQLFKTAKQMGLMSRDSVWILDESISGLLDSVDKSFISSAQGALGIKIYHSEDTRHFLNFRGQFEKMFRSEYPEEANSLPSYHALQAYDSITTVAEAVRNLGINETRTPQLLLQEMLSKNFTGLSGYVQFHNGMLSTRLMFRIVNIEGESYNYIGFWSSRFGFSDSLRAETEQEEGDYDDGIDRMKEWSGSINWPGELNRDPMGWAMPTDAEPLKIGVPGNNSFDKFVKVEWNETTGLKDYSGFCIDLFKEVVKDLEKSYSISIPYEFSDYNGTYDALIDHVTDKTYDAVIGDITILAHRSRKNVEFTQPFAESGLLMLVRVSNKPERAWIFVKPFTRNMWIGTFGIVFYTMFVIWFIEHQSKSNPDFRGPWKDQLGTALWFTFSSLFFSHREKINSSYTKVVVIVWLFVVFAFTSSYTASLTSMLTVQRLEPSVTNIESIKRTNATVGCDGNSFVEDYLTNVLEITNIKIISDTEDLKRSNITAVFLEPLYARIFLQNHSDYTASGASYPLGGLGFVFQKGSPITRDVSEGILTLSENGYLKDLEDYYFGSARNCSRANSTNETQSLGIESFWVLYLISGIISTICSVLFLIRLPRSLTDDNHAYSDVASNDKSTWKKVAKIVRTIGVVQYLNSARHRSLRRAPTFGDTVEGEHASTSWNRLSTPESLGTETEIQIVKDN